MLKRLFILLALPVAAYAGPIENLDKFIETTLVNDKIPGASVSIVQGDKVIFSKGYGLTRMNQPTKVDDRTIFQLASITKAFTAAGLGIFVDKGTLDWDKEVVQYLSGFALKDSYPTRYATTRDLLAHRTGLPAFGGDLLGKLGYPDAEILYRIRFIEPANSFRNKPYYSNVGYFIAGQVLSKLSNSTYEDAIANNILKPLAMNRSGFASNLNSTNVAYAHAIVDGKMKVIPWDRTGGFIAAGGVNSTAADMGNWMIMLLNGGKFQDKQILQSKTVEQMFAPSIVGDVSFSEMPPISEESGFSFGLGWDTYHYKNYAVVEKAGGLDGIRTVTTLIPELKLGITVLSNLNLTVFPEKVRAQFLESFVEKSGVDLQALINQKEGGLAKLLEPPEKPKTVLPNKYELDAYTGTFENQLYGTFKVTKKDKDLILEAGQAPYVANLIHWSNNTFLVIWPVVNLRHEATFTFGLDGKATEISIENLGTFRK